MNNSELEWRFKQGEMYLHVLANTLAGLALQTNEDGVKAAGIYALDVLKWFRENSMDLTLQ